MATGIQKAIAKAGSQEQLALALNVTQQAISLCLARGFVPTSRAFEIELLYGVSRFELISPKIMNIFDLGDAE